MTYEQALELGLIKIETRSKVSVYEYFKDSLGGRLPTDSSLADLSVDSECGGDCRKAIDAAAMLIECIKMAGNSEDIMNIIRATDHCIQIYWRG